MTLNKQLWLTIITVVLMNAAISFWLLFTSARQTFEEQLYLKNIDDANSLAIVLTQSDKNSASIELLIAAKFDAGHFSRIELTDTEGEELFKLTYENKQTNVPGWFKRLAEFNIPAGTAQVADGWSQFGTLYIESQTSFAVEMLWQRFKRFVISMLVITLLVGAAGSLILRFILRPLSNIVFQANSFSQRKFITIEKPATRDFERVVNAMNTLAERFKTIVVENNTRLEDARFRSQHDLVTGLPNINAFFTQLESQLRFRDKDGQNVLLVHSIASELYDIQSTLGDEFSRAISEFSLRIARFYNTHSDLYTDIRLARINETDIAILLTDAALLTRIQQMLEQDSAFSHGLPVGEDQQACICSAGVYLHADEASFEIMDRVDGLLQQAQNREELLPFCLEESPAHALQVNSQNWTQIIDTLPDNLTYHQAELKNARGQAIHYQSYFTLQHAGHDRNISFIARYAREVGDLPKVDLAVVEHALAQLASQPESRISVLLYQQTIVDDSAMDNLLTLLDSKPDIATRLCLELRESSAALYKQAFRLFCEKVREREVSVGLKRVGESFSQVADIHEYGLEYIKIDSAYVYDLKNNQSNQTYLRGLSDLAHSLGMKVYADGVCSVQDENILFEAGFDGVISLS
ncbi:bifunctional diguanylate cyclase/phosphodiesterase [Salinimonas lutimaris]|uniref:bifunctional diguanylate cyclase/phosphodiesterase n=1 Tax=Salinimonas lutimaris TaxID=914153 RepID=UPI0010C0CBB1|nr:LapD/MoxY N-terminal periplasmic domain-containing protein [Salinimonas lutimaris]